MIASSLRLSVSVTRSIAPLKEITRGLSTASRMICIRHKRRCSARGRGVTVGDPRQTGSVSLLAESWRSGMAKLSSTSLSMLIRQSLCCAAQRSRSHTRGTSEDAGSGRSAHVHGCLCGALGGAERVCRRCAVLHGRLGCVCGLSERCRTCGSPERLPPRQDAEQSSRSVRYVPSLLATPLARQHCSRRL